MSAIDDYLRAQREALVGAQAAARTGDVEAVHDMRVAVRRARATLRTFRPLLDAERTEPLREELRWLGEVLGRVRDADVMAARLTAMIDHEAPELIVGPVAARIAARLAAVSARARAGLIEALDSNRFEHLMSALTCVIDDAGAAVSRRRLRDRARRALLRAERLLDAAVTSLSTRDSTAAPRLHEARRAYKRARYAVEVVAPDGPPEAARLVLRLKAVQDLLGEVQDAVVAEGLLRDYAMSAYLDREKTFTYGLLYARQRPAGPWSVPGLARARRRADRPRLRRWLA